MKKFAENFVGFSRKIYIENVNVNFIRIYCTYNNISIYLYIYRTVRKKQSIPFRLPAVGKNGAAFVYVLRIRNTTGLCIVGATAF